MKSYYQYLPDTLPEHRTAHSGPLQLGFPVVLEKWGTDVSFPTDICSHRRSSPYASPVLPSHGRAAEYGSSSWGVRHFEKGLLSANSIVTVECLLQILPPRRLRTLRLYPEGLFLYFPASSHICWECWRTCRGPSPYPSETRWSLWFSRSNKILEQYVHEKLRHPVRRWHRRFPQYQCKASPWSVINRKMSARATYMQP